MQAKPPQHSRHRPIAPPPDPLRPPPRSSPAAPAIAFLAVLLIILWARLLPALLSGLASYVLYEALLRRFSRSTSHHLAALLSLFVTILALVAIVGLGAAGVRSAWAPHGGLPGLLAFLADALDKLRNSVPPWLAAWIPESTDALQRAGAQWLREHAASLQRWGESALRMVAQVLVGAIIGLLSAFERRPALQVAWARDVQRMLVDLGDAFGRIVSAQVRIAAANTIFTAIFLLVVLPLMDIHLPLATTLVAATFVAGFIPIVGNLLSNGAILIAALTVSPGVALAAFIFLVAIHKLEYFLNAHFVGARTDVPAPVLLASMLLLEGVFGVSGLVAAPVYCAWVFLEFGLARPAPIQDPRAR